MDVDGVLTDNGFWWSAGGEELKRFCYSDVTGIALAKGAGLSIALISGESSEAGQALARRYAAKLGVSLVYTGCHDKAAALHELAEKLGLDVSQCCYIGDDVIDIPALEIAGLAAAPADAHGSVLAKADYVARFGGGMGAVREILDLAVAARARRQ